MKKIKATDPEAKSPDLVAENVARLKALFPEIVTEGPDGAAINVDVLKTLVGDKTVTDAEEKYGLNWHGKRRARQLALTPSTGTLRPCPEESVDWDTTQNLMIEGDNLEVLKLLQKSYAGKVKLIYIDPPYNTEGDFIYPDRYQDNLETYLRYTGQIDGEGLKLTSATERSGRKHTNWLNMMLPRLKAARLLLRNDGIILTHIDEHEVANLTWLMDELFGPENSLGPIVWDKRNPKGDATKIATQHEYLIVYAQNVEALLDSHSLERPKANAVRMLAKARTIFAKRGTRQIPDDIAGLIKRYDLKINPTDYEQVYDLDAINREYQTWLKSQDVSGGEAAYKYIDEQGQVYRTVSMAWPNKKQAPDDYFIPLIHPRTKKPCPVPERGWRNPPATMKTLLNAGQIIFGEDETKQPERKYLMHENMNENIPSLLPYGGSDDALLKSLGIPFDNPKPVGFTRALLQCFLGEEGVVLDFFAGSATAGHACMELNAAQGKRHRFMLVQLPELLDPDKKEQKEAHKFCIKRRVPPNIAEIAKERLRRAAQKIKDENSMFAGDLGFRVFKLDSTNIREWEPRPDDLPTTIEESIEHLKTDRSEADILYEVLLKLGLDLCVPIETKEIARGGAENAEEGKGKSLRASAPPREPLIVYSIGGGVLIACLAEQITAAEVETLGQGIVEWQKALAPAGDTTCVFRDSAFADDVAKTNLAAILNQNGIVNVRSL